MKIAVKFEFSYMLQSILDDVYSDNKKYSTDTKDRITSVYCTHVIIVYNCTHVIIVYNSTHVIIVYNSKVLVLKFSALYQFAIGHYNKSKQVNIWHTFKWFCKSLLSPF